MPKLLTDAAVVDIRRMKADIRRLQAEVERLRYVNEPQVPHLVVQTPAAGIPPIDAQGKPGEGECKILRRWQQGKYLEVMSGATGGTVTVFNPFDVPTEKLSTMVAHRDPWGDLYVKPETATSFFYTGASGVPGWNTPYGGGGGVNLERLYWDGIQLVPFSPPRFEGVQNSCLGDVDADVVIIATKINGDWFVIVEDCNQPWTP